MKTLDKYILKEVVFLFVLGAIITVLLFEANQLMLLFKVMHVGSIPWRALLQVVLFRAPDFVKLSLIIGISLATSLTFARITRESEVKAMLSGGISIRRILKPILIFSVFVSLFSFVLLEKVVPISQKHFRNLLCQLYVISAAPDFKSDVVLDLDRYTARFGSVSRTKVGGIQLDDVFLLERPRPDETWIYSAKRGLYDDGVWNLEKPYVFTIQEDNLLVASPNKNLEINERISINPDSFMHATDEEESLGTILELIDKAEKEDRSTKGLWLSFHAKFSDSFACFVFAILGTLFSILYTKKGPFAGVFLSLASVLVFYITTILSDSVLLKISWMPPVVIAWMPNILAFLYITYQFREIRT